ncbi:hypothetical protein DFH08DRAFT_807349 [Mycena albidolilacea]|uniref:Uncharacterized protein n=1 Tax=Mycena albidolilacea TaxID=1033008 RepID=A0AAD7A5N7_9AGAR|nr:hypothetical protein DFH08DRAFT_807349 [Mycena albidolilacea]
MTRKLAAENATVIGQMFDFSHFRSWKTYLSLPAATIRHRSGLQTRSYLSRTVLLATGDAVLRYLGVLSHLAELVIWDTPGADAAITGTLLQGLIYTSDATGILPNLYFLGLTSRLIILDRWTRKKP